MTAGTGVRASAVLFVLASVLLLLLQPSVAQGQAAVPPAIDNLRQCLVDAGSDAHLLALIVVDESGSIRTTDPDARRIPAVRALLTSVRELAGQQLGGEDVDVEVRLTTFAEGYRPLEADDDQGPRWNPVVEGAIEPLQERVAVLADRTEGAWTDYRAAFSGARRDLALRSSDLTAETGVATCKLLVFFTDGMFEPSGGASALQEARTALCEAGGITDRLRDDGVITVTVGLATGITGPEAEFLAAVSEGSAGAQSCGSTGSPATGLALTADDADDLFFALGSLFPAAAELYCPTPDSVACSFDVPEAFTGFRLLIASPDANASIRLTAPSGRQVLLGPQESGEPELDDVGLRVRWPGDTNAEVATRHGSGAVSGTWQVQFEGSSRPDGTGRVDVYLRADLSLVLEDPSQLTAGSASELRVRLARADGAVVDPSGLGAELTVLIGVPALDRVLEAHQDPQGVFVAELEVPDDLPGNELLVDLRAASSEDDQTQVTVASSRARLPVITPGLATIEPLELRLPGLRGPGLAQATLTLVGADDADSCVSFRSSEISLPSLEEGGTAGSGRIDVTSEGQASGDCLQVAAGERRDVEVSVDVPTSGLGTARGGLDAVVESVGSSLQREVTVRVLLDLRPPPDPVRQWTIFMILMLIGIAVPLGVLYLAARRSSMFAPPQLLRMAEADVRWSVADGLRSMRDDGELVPDEFEVIDPTGRAERTTAVRLGDVELTRRLGRGPLGVMRGLFTGGQGIATARGMPVLAGSPSTSLVRYADEPSHEVPFGLASTWIFVLRRVETDTDDGSFVPPDEADGGEVLVGTLLYVVADGPNVLADGQRLLAHATGEISAAHRDLIASRTATTTHDTTTSTSPSTPRPSSPGDDDLPIT